MPSYLAIQQLLDAAGINYRAACALLHLKEKGSDSMSAIAGKLNITAAGMTGVADKLHHGQYIYRTHNRHGDTRCNTLVLTEKGRDLAYQLTKHLNNDL